MKILIDARLYGLENAGLGRYVMNLVGELKNLGTNDNFVVLLREKYYNELNLPQNWKKVLAEYRHYSIAEQLALPIILYKEKADVVHFPHFNVPILFFGNFMVTIHDVLMHKFVGNEATTLPKPLYLVRRLGYKIAFLKAIYASRRIIVPSNAVKGDIRRIYSVPEEKISVTYEGVDNNITRYSKETTKILNKYNLRRKYMIYAGNAYPHKNLEQAVKAVFILNKNMNTRIDLVIATSRGVFLDRLKKLILGLKAEKYVKIVGFVPDNELGTLYKNSVAYIYPSLSEGFGLQGLEALSVGTIVAASDIEVFREVYRDSVIYFNPRQTNSIVNSIKAILRMPDEKRSAMLVKAKEFVKRYSWAKMAQQTLKIYESGVGV